MAELDLIEAIQSVLGAPSERVVRWVGDDAAVVRARPLAVTSIDTLAEQVHFRLDTHSPADVGHKALGAALSDLAAMGAEAGEAYVSLALPETMGQDRALELVQGMAALAAETQLQHFFGVGRALCNLGEIAEEDGQPERALRLYVAARTLFEETGVAYQQYTSQRMAHLSGEVETSLDEIRLEARRMARAGMLQELAKWALQAAEAEGYQR